MRLVVLGRDGVINERRADGVLDTGDWRPFPGALAAVARLHHAHFHVVVVNNEPALGEGRMDPGALMRIHAHVAREVGMAGGRIDAMLYCPHRADEDCGCRLPAPGLLLELQRRLETDLAGVTMISDSLEGVQAAEALNMRPVLVTTGEAGSLHEAVLQTLVGVEIQSDLGAAVTSLLARETRYPV
jgi:D-glycero-D-manno-heptose 1,7-bisphosphate phosphatase